MDIDANGDSSPRVMSPAEVLETLGMKGDSPGSENKLEELVEEQLDYVEGSQAETDDGEHCAVEAGHQSVNGGTNGQENECSMLDEYHGDGNDGMTDDMSALSLHVPKGELDIFNDRENTDHELNGDRSETPSNVSTEQEIALEDEDFEELESVTTEASEDGKRNTKEEIFPLKSKLHCALCGGLCRDPRILSCLHTFCLECLQKRTEDKHRLIFCPICNWRMAIPKGGLGNIKKNEVIANLVSFQDAVSEDVYCVICLLHDEETEGTGRCVDCGDVLCSDCCEKHTFSRLTANHSVVTLKDYKDNMLLERRSQVNVMCEKHRDEEVKFFCEKCSTTACRDCIMLDHASHPCVTSNEVYEVKRENTVKGLDILKELQLEYENDDDEDSLKLIETEGKKLADKLEETAALAKLAIDEKLEKRLQGLQQELDNKRSQCCNRQSFIKKIVDRCQETVEIVEYFLKEGKPSELVAMDEEIRVKIAHSKEDFRAIHRKVSASHLPYIKVHERNMDVLQGLTLFTVESRDRKKSHSDKPTVKTVAPKTELTNSQKQVQQHKKTQGPLSQLLKQPVAGPPGPLTMGRGRYLNDKPSLLGDGSLYVSVGRGASRLVSTHSNSDSRVLGSMQASANSGQSNASYQGGYSLGIKVGATNSGDASSGRGASTSGTAAVGRGASTSGAAAVGRTGQKNTAKQQGNVINSHGEKHREMQQRNTIGGASHNDTDKGKQNRDRHNVPRVPDRQNVPRVPDRHNVPRVLKPADFTELALKSVVCTKTMKDRLEPDIVGMTFNNPQNFVVVDSRNLKLKLFAMDGKFLDMHHDQGPMSVVTLRDSLVWVSNGSSLKVLQFADSKHFSVLQCKLDNRIEHPITSFNDDKLIIGNHGKPTIKAFTVEGHILRKVHAFNPHDSDGKVIDHVTELATYKSNLLAMVVNKRVIINDFDGQFIGEYSESDWNPGCMCMDERNNIFVVDLAGNRLVLLSDKGQFRHHWARLTEEMSYITCNHRGIILVAGQSKNVSVYQYR